MLQVRGIEMPDVTTVTLGFVWVAVVIKQVNSMSNVSVQIPDCNACMTGRLIAS